MWVGKTVLNAMCFSVYQDTAFVFGSTFVAGCYMLRFLPERYAGNSTQIFLKSKEALPGETVLGSCCLLVCLEDSGSPAGGQKATRTPQKWWQLANNRFSYWRRFCFGNMLWSGLMSSAALYPAERKKFQPDVYIRDLCGYCGPQDSVQLLVFFS